MTATTLHRSTNDWRTADPIWADDVRASRSMTAISTELMTASAGLLALVAAFVALLA